MHKTSPPDRNPPPVREKHVWLSFEANVRRIGFFVLLFIVLAALSGLFSRGHFSHVERSSADNTLTISYERFNRQQSDVDMKIVAKAAGGETLTVTLGGEFMRAFKIDTLQPQPDKTWSQGQNLILEYGHSSLLSGETIWLGLLPQQPGSSTSTVTINNGPALSFWQFTYP
ncbi:hypothetical protein [Pseudescherichia sp.]|uniref:hypothetical protein n=1 Tax=Pseudescherichia sp. TaxID=2055881 RepID=UPI0028A6B62A|nr:hypothetical protein [Pseudescherichia sp.]